jgi:hypothetical protein
MLQVLGCQLRQSELRSAEQQLDLARALVVTHGSTPCSSALLVQAKAFLDFFRVADQVGM